MPNESEGRNIVEQQESQGVIAFTQAEEREMCIGSWRSRAQRESMKYIYKGSIHDIKEGSMIAVLATADPRRYPLCIAKVIKIEK